MEQSWNLKLELSNLLKEKLKKDFEDTYNIDLGEADVEGDEDGFCRIVLPEDKTVRPLFENLDPDMTGYISNEIYEAFLSELIGGLSHRQFNSLLRLIDPKNNGKIDYETFKILCVMDEDHDEAQLSQIVNIAHESKPQPNPASETLISSTNYHETNNTDAAHTYMCGECEHWIAVAHVATHASRCRPSSVRRSRGVSICESTITHRLSQTIDNRKHKSHAMDEPSTHNSTPSPLRRLSGARHSLNSDGSDLLVAPQVRISSLDGKRPVSSRFSQNKIGRNLPFARSPLLRDSTIEDEA